MVYYPHFKGSAHSYPCKFYSYIIHRKIDTPYLGGLFMKDLKQYNYKLIENYSAYYVGIHQL